MLIQKIIFVVHRLLCSVGWRNICTGRQGSDRVHLCHSLLWVLPDLLGNEQAAPNQAIPGCQAATITQGKVETGVVLLGYVLFNASRILSFLSVTSPEY